MKPKRIELGMQAVGSFGMAMFHKLSGSIFTIGHDEEYYDYRYTQDGERRYSAEEPLYRNDNAECDFPQPRTSSRHNNYEPLNEN